MNNQTYFSPWVRKGLGLHINEKDLLGLDCQNSLIKNRPTVTVSAEICGYKDKEGKVKETRYESKEISIAGPGDVLNITTKAIKHVFPESSNGTIVVNHRPYIEFWEPDFAWRYTPACANEGNLRPWIALVVCEEGKYNIEQNKVTFVVDSEEEYKKIFPDPKEIYKSAHAQGDSDEDVTFCRILCLGGASFKEENSIFGKESKYFRAFLIPVFEVGRLRGLGYSEDILSTTPAQAPAWEESWARQKGKKDSLVFPFYYSWTLQPKGKSFNQLVQELKPNNDVEDGIYIDVTALGEGLSCKSSDTPQKNGTICMPAALGPTSDNPEEAFPSQGTNLYKNLKNLLSRNPVFSENKEIINEISYNAEKDNEDPWIVPPVYGAKHVLATSLESNDTPPWLKQINLDLHHRAAAGLGKKVVQRHQEEFVHRAWEQVEFVKSINADLNQKMLSVNVQKSIQKHNYKWLESEADKKKLLARLIMNLPLMRDVGSGSDENSSSSISKILTKKGIPQSFATTSFLRRTGDIFKHSKEDTTETSSLMERIAENQTYTIPVAKDLIKAPSFSDLTNFFSKLVRLLDKKEGLLNTAEIFSKFSCASFNRQDFGQYNSAFSIRTMMSFSNKTSSSSDSMYALWDRSNCAGEDNNAAHMSFDTARFNSSVGWIKKKGKSSIKDYREPRNIYLGKGSSPQPINNGDNYDVIALETSKFKKTFPKATKSIVRIQDKDKDICLLFVNRDEIQKQNSPIKKFFMLYDKEKKEIKMPSRYPSKDEWKKEAQTKLCNGENNSEVRIYLEYLYCYYFNPSYILADAELISNTEFVEDFNIQVIHNSLVSLWSKIQSIKQSSPSSSSNNNGNNNDNENETNAKIEILVKSLINSKTNEYINKKIEKYFNIFLNNPESIKKYKASLSTSKYPIMAYPIFPEPTYYYLKAISDEFILPGIDDIENNTISMFKNNPTFIESFLCGMNTEMGRELLWREYPTDQRGSYFCKFWDTDVSIDDIKDDNYFDVKSLHDWKNDIGHNHLGNKGDLLVFAIRGDLMKAYPDTKITLRKAYYDATAHNELKLVTDDNLPDNILEPTSQAFIRDDIYIVSFDISPDDAIGTFNTNRNINSGYFLSFEKNIENTEFKAKVSPSSNLSNAALFATEHLVTAEIYNIHVSTLISE
ncbi:MAG: hypothetical protein IK012_01285 [Fibrobacter sp.]|uniref:hypothetical protein n=1 Tax=Fibrobacter sp. TaxID=35828 RepID=UPI0025BE75AF|nr:hypothetical protein [Fibrobacter sp.]MBR4783874.1 hypothetical protein [Fibrobacter sp.]